MLECRAETIGRMHMTTKRYPVKRGDILSLQLPASRGRSFSIHWVLVTEIVSRSEQAVLVKITVLTDTPRAPIGTETHLSIISADAAVMSTLAFNAVTTTSFKEASAFFERDLAEAVEVFDAARERVERARSREHWLREYRLKK